MFGEIVIRADMRYNYNDPGHWTRRYMHLQAPTGTGQGLANTDQDWQNIFDTCKIEWNIKYTKTLNIIGCCFKRLKYLLHLDYRSIEYRI